MRTAKKTSPEQLPNTPDGAFRNDGVYHTGEQWGRYDECVERGDDEEQGNDDEELQPLMEKELEALATVTQANRTLVQARQAVKDARATGQPSSRRSAAASVRESGRRGSVSWSSFGSGLSRQKTRHLARVRRDNETT